MRTKLPGAQHSGEFVRACQAESQELLFNLGNDKVIHAIVAVPGILINTPAGQLKQLFQFFNNSRSFYSGFPEYVILINCHYLMSCAIPDAFLYGSDILCQFNNLRI